MNINLHHGNCIEILPTLPADSVDGLLTDPPSGISFMGKDWDNKAGYVPVTKTATKAYLAFDGLLDDWERGFLAFTIDWAIQCLRVMKPGSSGFVWALPRTSDLTMMSLRMAGFEVRDVVVHLFASGYPKSYNIAKGVEGKLTKGSANWNEWKDLPGEDKGGQIGYTKTQAEQGYRPDDYTGRGKNFDLEPTTEQAAAWEGYGTALKPAAEHWIWIMKPREGSFVDNALKWGVAGLHIDGGRIALGNDYKCGSNERPSQTGLKGTYDPKKANRHSSVGRWPANVTLEHTPDCELVGYEADGYHINRFTEGARPFGGGAGEEYASESVAGRRAVYACAPDCPVRMLDEQSGMLKSGKFEDHHKIDSEWGYMGGKRSELPLANTYGDDGPASRFYYCAKPSKTEKGADNNHPTVKPIELMRYFLQLLKTPTGGVILDPFLGSGTTGVACVQLCLDIIGIEQDAAYFELAEKRIYGEPPRMF